MRCLAMGGGAFESPDLGALSRYLKHILADEVIREDRLPYQR